METQNAYKTDPITGFRFKDIETDSEEVYAKLKHRIQYQALLYQTGVSSVWKYISVAASVLLVVMSSLYVGILSTPDVQNYLEVNALAGTKTRLQLPDSSIVWLNGNSMIRYPQTFTAKNREVEVSGEVMFEVTKDKMKPFIVKVDRMSVHVLGTIFNLFADPLSDMIETTLQEGSVALYSNTNRTNRPNRLLHPNQQAVFNKNTGEIEVLEVDAEAYTSWVDGSFLFEGNTLDEIMKLLGRAFCVKIHVQNPKLKEMRLSAQFYNHETLDEILSILQVSAKYTYEKRKGEIYIH